MNPVGYLYKKVALRPDWIKAEGVRDIYSLSGCVSENFADYINYWKHNGYWLFDTPAIMHAIVSETSINLKEMTLFYYEVYEEEYREGDSAWFPFETENNLSANVGRPIAARLEGFDVVTFFAHTSPECSPLSCCNLAEELDVNSHCLFDTFEQAKQALDSGKFNDTEPGPFRIFAVYSVEGAG